MASFFVDLTPPTDDELEQTLSNYFTVYRLEGEVYNVSQTQTFHDSNEGLQYKAALLAARRIYREKPGEWDGAELEQIMEVIGKKNQGEMREVLKELQSQGTVERDEDDRLFYIAPDQVDSVLTELGNNATA